MEFHKKSSTDNKPNKKGKNNKKKSKVNKLTKIRYKIEACFLREVKETIVLHKTFLDYMQLLESMFGAALERSKINVKRTLKPNKESIMLSSLTIKRFKIAFLFAQVLEKKKLIPESFLHYLQTLATLFDGSCGKKGIKKVLEGLAIAENYLINISEA